MKFREFPPITDIVPQMKMPHKSSLRTFGDSIPLETGRLLRHFCEHKKPRRILDMSVGFNNYVFRSYQAAKAKVGMKPVVVYTVDNDEKLLTRAEKSLKSKGLGTDTIMTVDELNKGRWCEFELVFAGLESQSFQMAFDLAKDDGWIFIPNVEYHEKSSRWWMAWKLLRENCHLYDVRDMTRCDDGRYAMLGRKMTE